MKVGSLFSGGGLGDFGFLMAGCEIVFQVEIDEYCQKILQLRYPDAKKFRDIRAVKGIELPECDIITGGFPCQDLSYAGKGAGITGERSGLWKEYLRLICEIRPRYVVVENVPGLLSRGMGVVLGDLASCGYDAEWECISAEAVGAPHKRDRVWIVGYPQHSGFNAAEITRSVKTGNDDCSARKKQASEPSRSDKQHEKLADTNNVGCFYGQAQEQSAEGRIDAQRELEPSCSDVAYAKSTECERTRNTRTGRIRYTDGRKIFGTKPTRNGWWSTEPLVGRLAHGVANRVERIKLLGNGQVPYCTKWIAEQIIAYEKFIEADRKG